MMKTRLVLGWWVVIGATLCSYVPYTNRYGRWWQNIPMPLFAAGAGLAMSLMIAFKPVGFIPFIYFQF